MNLFFGILVIIMGGSLGIYLDYSKKMKAPASYYLLGYIVATIVSVILK